MRKLTEADFARYCSHIASRAASWAADLLSMQGLDDVARVCRPEDVARFTDDIRARLDHIDQSAGRAALQQEGDAS